jgi:TolA-binding protein
VSAAPQLASAAPPLAPAAADGSASDDFRTAVAALHRGESRDAAAKFERFLERYPGDPRAEDAAYLRVLALRQTGDDGATQSAARAYLRRYPEGFRRSEVEKLTAP